MCILRKVHIDRRRNDPVIPRISPIARIERGPSLDVFDHSLEQPDLPPFCVPSCSSADAGLLSREMLFLFRLNARLRLGRPEGGMSACLPGLSLRLRRRGAAGMEMRGCRQGIGTRGLDLCGHVCRGKSALLVVSYEPLTRSRDRLSRIEQERVAKASIQPISFSAEAVYREIAGPGE